MNNPSNTKCNAESPIIDTNHLDEMEGLAFTTDGTGTITAVSETSWNKFASENGAVGLDAASLINCSVFDFISGVDVQREFRDVLQRVSKSPNCRCIIPFRCDSPECCREMKLSIIPMFSDDICTGFIFHSVELRSEQRDPIELFNFKALEKQAATANNLPIVVMCSWCQRVRYKPISGSAWIEAEDYQEAGGVSRITLTHGICEDCLETVSITTSN